MSNDRIEVWDQEGTFTKVGRFSSTLVLFEYNEDVDIRICVSTVTGDGAKDSRPEYVLLICGFQPDRSYTPFDFIKSRDRHVGVYVVVVGA